MFRRIKNFFENLKYLKTDIENKKAFIEDVSTEFADPASAWNDFHLKPSEDYMEISAVIYLPDDVQITSTDAVKYVRLKELLYPIHNYFNIDLHWGEHLTKPELYYVDDYEDKTNESRTYVAKWRYRPILLEDKGFWAEVAAFIGINVALVGGLITALVCLL